MSSTSDFYLARAEECAREAERAQLDNVRERHLRAEKAWRALAEQLLFADRLRQAREAEPKTASVG
ncbi:hypothetical protein [Sphingomonas montanisoli]|uniref:Uncharacterized protein n=1 Tax=Sphingomonas montanisoli TaxID=2606412 RepID=A0A5D9CDG9_9SPHN|nr:hypothetical protein [Sphingomonas montanisoli]TZG29303.1 hypothetical protein FYJ91_04015 [Sphingomonas montanisoli]